MIDDESLQICTRHAPDLRLYCARLLLARELDTCTTQTERN